MSHCNGSRGLRPSAQAGELIARSGRFAALVELEAAGWDWQAEAVAAAREQLGSDGGRNHEGEPLAQLLPTTLLDLGQHLLDVRVARLHGVGLLGGLAGFGQAVELGQGHGGPHRGVGTGRG